MKFIEAWLCNSGHLWFGLIEMRRVVVLTVSPLVKVTHRGLVLSEANTQRYIPRAEETMSNADNKAVSTATVTRQPPSAGHV